MKLAWALAILAAALFAAAQDHPVPSAVPVLQIDTPGGLDSSTRKIVNNSAAYLRSLAQMRDAEGELQASAKLLEAAQKLAQAPQAMQLRYLQTLTAIAGEKVPPSSFRCPST